ncbi:hypothetical protein CI102_1349 [Trichoderma harzianum]|nr:hypothetical protein CI102_1349 [Trichoderma harzianum]
MPASLFRLTLHVASVKQLQDTASVMRPWIDTPLPCLSNSLICPASYHFPASIETAESALARGSFRVPIRVVSGGCIAQYCRAVPRNCGLLQLQPQLNEARATTRPYRRRTCTQHDAPNGRDFRYPKVLTVSLALAMCGWPYMNHATIVRHFLCPSAIYSLFVWTITPKNHSQNLARVCRRSKGKINPPTLEQHIRRSMAQFVQVSSVSLLTSRSLDRAAGNIVPWIAKPDVLQTRGLHQMDLINTPRITCRLCSYKRSQSWKASSLQLYTRTG